MVFNLQRALSIAEVISMTPTLPNATLRLATSSSWSHLTFSCNLEVLFGTQSFGIFFQTLKSQLTNCTMKSASSEVCYGSIFVPRSTVGAMGALLPLAKIAKEKLSLSIVHIPCSMSEPYNTGNITQHIIINSCCSIAMFARAYTVEALRIRSCWE